jgi:hypothetical protein
MAGGTRICQIVWRHAEPERQHAGAQVEQVRQAEHHLRGRRHDHGHKDAEHAALAKAPPKR